MPQVIAPRYRWPGGGAGTGGRGSRGHCERSEAISHRWRLPVGIASSPSAPRNDQERGGEVAVIASEAKQSRTAGACLSGLLRRLRRLAMTRKGEGESPSLRAKRSNLAPLAPACRDCFVAFGASQ